MLFCHAAMPANIFNTLAWVGNVADDIYLPPVAPKPRRGRPVGSTVSFVVVARRITRKRPTYGERVRFRLLFTEKQARLAAAKLASNPLARLLDLSNVTVMPLEAAANLPVLA